MNSSEPLMTPMRMNMYEPLHQLSSWIDCYREDNCPNTLSASALLEVEEKLHSEDTSQGTPPPQPASSNNHDQKASKSSEKTQRRLAQNREAARKNRLRKKAYVKQLESSRLKLVQIEQDLQRKRQQGLCIGGEIDHLPVSTTSNSGIADFESGYGHWLEEQKRQICELRAALQSNTSEDDLRIHVNNSMNLYLDLFRMKEAAAIADVFYLMSGMWKSPAERFFFWIGGFRPTELLKLIISKENWQVIVPTLGSMTEKQQMDVDNLEQSCQQAEDALTQGMERLRQNLSDTVAAIPIDGGSYFPQMSIAAERLEALVSFVNQADHLRMETLLQMHRILTTRQAARGLLVLGEYFHRLKALSSLWADRGCLHPA